MGNVKYCVNNVLKRCYICEEFKDKSRFSASLSNLDKLAYGCKDCESRRSKEARDKYKSREYIAVPDFKDCSICCKIKTNKEFYLAPKEPVGLRPECIECGKKEGKKKKDRYRNRSFIKIPEFKICSKCKEEKSGDSFVKSKSEKGGIVSECKECAKNRRLVNKYGITLEWYKTTLKSQLGGCAICNRETYHKDGSVNFSVDHDHSSDKIRGLLCYNCNIGLGQFKDSILNIKTAIDYLKTSREAVFDILGRKGKRKFSKRENHNFTHRLKITEEQRKFLLSNQNNCCKICNIDISRAKKKCLDHCHKTGKVRGVLCNGCNAALGSFKESVDILQKAIDYLKKHGKE